MNYTELEFNELAAKSEGLETRVGYTRKEPYLYTRLHDSYNPYSDLNQLMPLVFKHGLAIFPGTVDNGEIKRWSVDITNHPTIGKSGEDPIQAIRDCLYQIWSES